MAPSTTMWTQLQLTVDPVCKTLSHRFIQRELFGGFLKTGEGCSDVLVLVQNGLIKREGGKCILHETVHKGCQHFFFWCLKVLIGLVDTVLHACGVVRNIRTFVCKECFMVCAAQGLLMFTIVMPNMAGTPESAAR